MPRRKRNRNLPAVRQQPVEQELMGMSSDFMNFYRLETDVFNWSVTQHKLFALIIGKLSYDKKNEPSGGDDKYIVKLDNVLVAKELGWNDEDPYGNLSGMLRSQIISMGEHGTVALLDPYTNKWVWGPIFTLAYGDSMNTWVEVNKTFMPHFERLYDYSTLTKKPFFTFLVPDLTSFETEFGRRLFLKLRGFHSSKKSQTYRHVFSTEELKETFCMNDNAYMRINPNTGNLTHFNRSMFEAKALIPALEDVNRTEMVKVLSWPDGTLFKKVKQNGKVKGYELKWQVLNHSGLIKQRNKKLAAAKKANLPISGPDYVNHVIPVEPEISEIDLFEDIDVL